MIAGDLKRERGFHGDCLESLWGREQAGVFDGKQARQVKHQDRHVQHLVVCGRAAEFAL